MNAITLISTAIFFFIFSCGFFSFGFFGFTVKKNMRSESCF